MIDIDDLIRKANGLIDLIPLREVSDGTAAAYRKTLLRMLNSGRLDPLQDGMALDTYYHRRAALHFGARLFLTGARDQCLAAAANGDHATAERWARKLRRAIERLEPILLLEAPAAEDTLPWERPASRWHQSSNSNRQRGQNSKANVLAYLPKDWDTRVWKQAAAQGVWPYLDTLAVHLIVPLRPEELVPGPRPIGWSPGVLVELRSVNRLVVTFAPAKSHNGLYGTGLTEICVDPVIFGDAAQYLAARCRASGGRIVVSTKSKNAFRKALAKLGSKALPELGAGVQITAYVFRHQVIADMKKTFGGGEEVAAAAGQGTDRTQSHYADIKYGRTRKGYISIKAARRPRCGNVERGRQLSRAKAPRAGK